MINTRKMGLTFAQVLVGCCAGALAGGVSLLLINLMWRETQSWHLGGFLTALLLLISFLIVYAASVVGTAEGVRQMGRFIPKQASRRKMYEGAFLGICAAVAILTVTRGDWISTLEEWGGPIKTLGTLIYMVLIRPIQFVTGWIPPRFVLLISAPIGAAIAYNVTPHREKASTEEDSQPVSGKDKKK